MIALSLPKENRSRFAFYFIHLRYSWAHKIVLAANSKLFRDEFADNEKSVVTIPDLSFEVMQGFVDFFYSGKVDDLVGSDEDLFYGAHVLKLDTLKVSRY